MEAAGIDAYKTGLWFWGLIDIKGMFSCLSSNHVAFFCCFYDFILYEYTMTISEVLKDSSKKELVCSMRSRQIIAQDSFIR